MDKARRRPSVAALRFFCFTGGQGYHGLMTRRD